MTLTVPFYISFVCLFVCYYDQRNLSCSPPPPRARSELSPPFSRVTIFCISLALTFIFFSFTHTIAHTAERARGARLEGPVSCVISLFLFNNFLRLFASSFFSSYFQYVPCLLYFHALIRRRAPPGLLFIILSSSLYSARAAAPRACI